MNKEHNIWLANSTTIVTNSTRKNDPLKQKKNEKPKHTPKPQYIITTNIYSFKKYLL